MAGFGGSDLDSMLRRSAGMQPASSDPEPIRDAEVARDPEKTAETPKKAAAPKRRRKAASGGGRALVQLAGDVPPEIRMAVGIRQDLNRYGGGPDSEKTIAGILEAAIRKYLPEEVKEAERRLGRGGGRD